MLSKDYVLTLSEIVNRTHYGYKYGPCELCQQPYDVGYIATVHRKGCQERYTVSDTMSFCCQKCGKRLARMAKKTFHCSSGNYIHQKKYQLVS